MPPRCCRTKKNGKKNDGGEQDEGEEDEENGGKPSPRKRTNMDLAWSDACNVKKEYMTVMCSADGVINSSETDRVWDAFHHDIALLRAALASLKGVLGDFGKNLTMKDPKVVRKEYKGQEKALEALVRNFTSEAKPKIVDVSVITRRLLAMHSARASVN